MLNAPWLLTELIHQRVGCITGVPCSYISDIYSLLESGTWPYVSATSEGESVAVAAGAWLAGSQGVALCQNSGLGNMTNPLSSLVEPYRIPVILGVSRRGWPAGTDEPQHALMGEITPALLELMGVHAETLDASPDVAGAQLAAAAERCAGRHPTALIIEKGVFGKAGTATGGLETGTRPAAEPGAAVRNVRGGHLPTRAEIVTAYLELDVPWATVATTGYTSRELYAQDDRDAHFYMAGSMGCAPAIGLGIAATSGHPVTVLDGDGALLMRMGTLAAVGHHVRTPFVHVLINNGRHESTGGQRTNAGAADFAAIARACGYRSTWRCEGIDAVKTALRDATSWPGGPVLVECLTRPGASSGLPRPKQPLPDLALRFRTHLTDRLTAEYATA